MIPVGKLKSNLQFNKNFGDLVEIMKLAATLQFNQFRLKPEPSQDAIGILDNVFDLLLAAKVNHRLLQPNESLPALLLLVSSDEGFLGELNFLLVNKLLVVRKQADSIICVGQQGANYLREISVNFSSFDSPGEKNDARALAKISDYLLSQYATGKIGRIYVVYARFVNITSQQAELETLLPLSGAPEKMRGAVSDLLIEPDEREVIRGWIKTWLDFRLFKIFWSAKLAELAARIMHLEGSVQELGKINSNLRMEYFKYLHSLSDKSIRELTASRLISRN